MVDWFVLLAPLVSLPIALLLVFLGCTLNRFGEGPILVRFDYGPGCDQNVESIVLSFQWVDVSGESPSNRHEVEIMKGPEINPAGGAVEKWSLADFGDEGRVDLTCSIQKSNNPNEIIKTSSLGKPSGENFKGSFNLWRGGEDLFTLTSTE
jgi:hypothetical protein